jgi:hypothetical protein
MRSFAVSTDHVHGRLGGALGGIYVGGAIWSVAFGRLSDFMYFLCYTRKYPNLEGMDSRPLANAI